MALLDLKLRGENQWLPAPFETTGQQTLIVLAAEGQVGAGRAQSSRRWLSDAAAVGRALPDLAAADVIQRTLRRRRSTRRGPRKDGAARRVSRFDFWINFRLGRICCWT